MEFYRQQPPESNNLLSAPLRLCVRFFFKISVHDLNRITVVAKNYRLVTIATQIQVIYLLQKQSSALSQLLQLAKVGKFPLFHLEG